VVHARDIERGSSEVGVDRAQRAAEDRTLAAAVVEQVHGVDHAPPVDAKDAARAESGRVDQVAAEIQEVDHPLLEAIRNRGEAREVLQRRDRVRYVLLRHPDLVGRTRHQTERRKRVELIAVHLVGGAEQAVPVEHGLERLTVRRRDRDVALEVSADRVPGIGVGRVAFGLEYWKRDPGGQPTTLR
jgi:hypothetical protein